MDDEHVARELEALRRGDEATLVEVLERDYPATLRFASLLDPEHPREVARAAWLDSFELDGLDDAPTLRAWLLRRIVGRTSLGDVTSARRPAEDLFEPAGHLWAGHWRESVPPWPEQTAGVDARSAVARALSGLDDKTAAVVLLRDVERLAPDEVETVLELDDEEQRVLLHDGRVAVRDALASAFERESA